MVIPKSIGRVKTVQKKPCHFLQKPRPAVYVQNYVAPMPRGQEPIKTSERETEHKSDFGRCQSVRYKAMDHFLVIQLVQKSKLLEYGSANQ